MWGTVARTGVITDTAVRAGLRRVDPLRALVCGEPRAAPEGRARSPRPLRRWRSEAVEIALHTVARLSLRLAPLEPAGRPAIAWPPHPILPIGLRHVGRVRSFRFALVRPSFARWQRGEETPVRGEGRARGEAVESRRCGRVTHACEDGHTATQFCQCVRARHSLASHRESS
eukprot:scaffold201478_cov31-Tisochrysis_lutea.AAC.4